MLEADGEFFSPANSHHSGFVHFVPVRLKLTARSARIHGFNRAENRDHQLVEFLYPAERT
jgi:hypothetical protein